MRVVAALHMRFSFAVLQQHHKVAVAGAQAQEWVVAPRGRPGDGMGAHPHLLVWQGIPRTGQVHFTEPCEVFSSAKCAEEA